MKNILQPEQLKLTENYIKIMLGIVRDYNFNIRTGMTIPEEEALREEFTEFVLNSSSALMVELTKQIIDLVHQLIPYNFDLGRLTVSMLENSIGIRYSTAYLKKHPDLDSRLTELRERISYTLKEEIMLTQLIKPIKSLPVPESGIVDLEMGVNSLIEQITGISGLDKASQERINKSYSDDAKKL